MIQPSDFGLPEKFTKFRSEVGQDKTILNLLSSNKRFSIINAGPGTGKTLITVATSLGLSARTLYLTVTKSLQHQLLNDFSSIGLFNIIGHSNYSCANLSYDDDGELADLECKLKRQLSSNGNSQCLYANDISIVNERDIVSTNYAHYVQILKSDDPNKLGKFDLLILDEAHRVHDLLCDYVAIKLSINKVKSLLNINLPNIADDWFTWLSWANEAREIAANKYKSIKSTANYSRRNLLLITRLGKDLKRIIEEITPKSVANINDKPDGADWIKSTNYNRTIIQFTPVSAKSYTNKYLFNSMPRILLTSATIDKQDAIDLGIDLSDLDFIEIESSFPANRRPIIYIPTSPVPIRITSKISLAEFKLCINRLDSIIAPRRDDRKGLIQAISYERAIKIINSSANSDIMITHKQNAREKELALRHYKQSAKPCILVSPSFEEGEDLPFDLCRYLIWFKVPFLDSRDQRLEIRKLRDKTFSDRMVARRIIQGSLRGMRSMDDFCEIFFFDQLWTIFSKKPYFAKWFRQSFQFVNRLPMKPTI